MSEYTGKFIDGDGLALINQLIDEKLKNLGGGGSGSYADYKLGEHMIGTAIDGRPLYRYVGQVTPANSPGVNGMYQIKSFAKGYINQFYRCDVFQSISSTTYNSNMWSSDSSIRLYIVVGRSGSYDRINLYTSKPDVVHTYILEYTKTSDPPNA